MTDNLQTFTNSEFGSIRTLNINNNIYFVVADVCKILDLKNPTVVVNSLDNDEWAKFNLGHPYYETNLVTEAGLYHLIFKSRKPEAKKFQRWIYHEVIPSIRKTGAYFTNDIAQEIMNDPQKLLDIFKNFAIEREKRLQAEETLKLQAPKVLFADAVETSDKDILVGELAKLISQNGVQIGQNRLFKWLRENGYLIKGNRADYNMPVQKYLDMGLFRIKETTIIGSNGETKLTRTTKVTGKGQVYFVNKFLNNGDSE